MNKRRYGRDVGLQMRMAFTMLLLTVVYLIFAGVLFRFTHAGMILFLIPLAGLFFQYYFSDKLVLAGAGAKIIEPSQSPELYGIVQRLAQQADLPMPRVAIVETPMPNAFATGRSPKHAVVAVTSGLLRQLSRSELESVLAHEMTHIRNRDMTIMTMAGSFAAVASWISQMWMWVGGGFNDDRREGNGWIVVLLVSVVVAFISHLLVMALSRYREYAADRGGALLTGEPEQLASALLRISGTMAAIPTKDLREAQPLSALYIAAPSRETVIGIFADHPPIEKRIARLQALQREMVVA